jgi:hypothetical protein
VSTPGPGPAGGVSIETLELFVELLSETDEV